MALPSISSPVANATVHSQFTVTGTVAPAGTYDVRILVWNSVNSHTDFAIKRTDGTGNWTQGFIVNPDNYSQGNTFIEAWTPDSSSDVQVTVIA